MEAPGNRLLVRFCNLDMWKFIKCACAFSLQVENKREELLSHPLVTFLLHYKWQKFGRYIYYFKLALFCIFLFFLTGYTIYSTQLNKLSKDMLNKSSFPHMLWIDIGRFVILALASWHIALEVSDLCVIFFLLLFVLFCGISPSMNWFCFGFIKLLLMSSTTSGYFRSADDA